MVLKSIPNLTDNQCREAETGEMCDVSSSILNKLKMEKRGLIETNVKLIAVL